MDENFRQHSLLSGFSDSKLGSMFYAQGRGVLDGALQASCAALTGERGGNAALSGFDAAQLKDMMLAMAFGEGLGFLQGSGLPFTGRLEVSGNLLSRGASGWEVLTVQPLWRDALEQNHIFTQLSWNRTIGRAGYVDGDVFNAGLAYRRLSADRSVVYGLNAFIDHAPEMNHNRMSIGADVQTEQIGVSANKYIPLSDWKSVDAYKEERASSGFDVELQGRLPSLPSWQLNLKGFQWSSNEEMEGKTTWGYDAGVQWQPVNALVWEAGVRNEQDASPQFHTQLRMVYRFGEPLEKMWERPAALASMEERVYDKVRRDNAMRIEQRVKEAAYVTVTQSVGANRAALEGGSVMLSVGQQLPRPLTVTVSAAPLSIVRLVFRDGGILTIGEGSQVRIEAGLITLISGLFQYVSGSGGPPSVIAVPGGTVTLLGTDIDVSTNGATSVLRVRDGAARLNGTSSGSVTLGVAQAAASVDGVVGAALAPHDPAYVSHTDDVSVRIDRVAVPQAGVKVAPYPVAAPRLTATATTPGQTIAIALKFNAPVDVTGVPQLTLDVNGHVRQAAYSAGAGTNELTFSYTLQGGDAGATAVTVQDIDLNGGTVTGDGKDAVTTLADTGLDLGAPVVVPLALGLDFVNGAYSLNGTGYASFTAIPGASFTRAAPAVTYAEDSAGNLVPFAANTPRITDKGLLIEGQRTNLIPNGEGAGASGTSSPSGWVVDQGFGGLYFTSASSGTDAQGYGYFQYRIAGTTVFTNRLLIRPHGGSGRPVTSGQVYTLSYGIERVAGSYPYTFQINFAWLDAGGNTISSSYGAFRTPSGTKVRYSETATAPAGAVNVRIWLDHTGYNGPTGTPVDFTLRVSGVQLEEGAFASSYIPTTSGVVTRDRDVVDISTGSWFNPNAGTYYAAWNKFGGNNSRILSFNVTVNTPITHSVSNRMQIFGSTINLDGGPVFPNVLNKGASSYATGIGIAATSNAGPVVTTTDLLPTPTILRIGPVQGTNEYYGWIQDVRYYGAAKTNAELQALTAP